MSAHPQYCCHLNATYHSDAPSAVGPYSQAIKAGQFIFVSGCVALNPQTMKLVDGGIKEQATQALANMKAVVEASGSSINQIAKCTVSYLITFLSRMLLTLLRRSFCKT